MISLLTNANKWGLFFLQRFEKQILLSIRMQQNARLHSWMAERYEGYDEGLKCTSERFFVV